MTTFHVQINDGPEQQILALTGQYNLAAVAALALLEHESRKPDQDIVKIWVPELLPHYGPYFYAWNGERIGSYIPDRNLVLYSK